MKRMLGTSCRKILVCGIFALASSFALAEGKYMIIDVSSGADSAKYPVSYLDAVPEGGWSDIYKTEKIVLVNIKGGSFWRRTRTAEYPYISADEKSTTEVKVEKSFYIGVFPVTQKQWELVMGTRPSWFRKDDCYAMRPVENVSYDAIRGRRKGAMYPLSREVDDGSFLEKLRSNTKVADLDLPTEDMWEMACRGLSLTEYNGGEQASTSMLELGRYSQNSGGYSSANRDSDAKHATAIVGKYQVNKFGLYDTHGNVCEWCLDLANPSDRPEPISPLELGKDRICKGGFHESDSPMCAASIGYGKCSSTAGDCVGFRIASF